MSTILTRSGSKRRLLTVLEGNEEDEEEFLEASNKKPRTDNNNNRRKVIIPKNQQTVRIADQVTVTPGEIKAAIVQLTKEDKYCQKLYEFKTDKGDKHQIAIVFTECDKKGDKKGGKKPFYSRKGRRNKRSRKTRKRK